jgi:hypothetical protein
MSDKTSSGREDSVQDSTSSDIQLDVRVVPQEQVPEAESLTSTQDRPGTLAYGHGKAIRKIIRGRIIHGPDTDKS